MDRIKKLKIKKSDGTFSDYVPIGADAEYIDMEDGITVQEAIDDINDRYAKYYNNVEEMKADENLKVGDTAITLGYYEPNDGGNGTYKIINNKTLISIELNNSLYANLIINQNLNIKQLGAKIMIDNSDYINPITTILNNAINYIMNLAYKNLNKNYNFNLIIPEGNYYIDNTIKLSSLVHLVPKGVVTFICKSSEDTESITFFKIGTYDEERSPYISGEIFSRFNTPIIGGQNGSIHISGKDNKHNIAISIDGISSKSVAEQEILSNIYINNFKIGLNFILTNTYLNKFYNLKIDGCEEAIRTSLPIENSGENITFDKCSFAINNTVVNFKDSITNFKFIDCSFDGNGCIFYQNKSLFGLIILDRCWIEAIGYGMSATHEPISYNGKRGIIYIEKYTIENEIREYLKTKYIFTNCRYVDSSSQVEGCSLDYLFYGNTLTLYLDKFYYESWLNQNNTAPRYLCDDTVKEIYYNDYICSPYTGIPFIKTKNLLQYPEFTFTATGEKSITVGDFINKELKIKSISNIASIELIAPNNEDRYLKITKTDTTQSANLVLTTNFYIKNKCNDKYIGRFYMKNDDNTKTGLAQNFSMSYYDLNGNDVSINTWSEYKTDNWTQLDDKYFYPTYIQHIDTSCNFLWSSMAKFNLSFTMTSDSSQIAYIKYPEIMSFSGNPQMIIEEVKLN